MTTMGKYCKAYPLKALRGFSEWSERAENAGTEKEMVGGKEIERVRRLSDDDYLYLQTNYVVTDGIFMDKHIIFDDVTPAWIEYCQKVLQFEIPVDALPSTYEADGEDTAQ